MTNSVGTGYGSDATFITAGCDTTGGGGGGGGWGFTPHVVPVVTITPPVNQVISPIISITSNIPFIFTKVLQIGSRNKEVLELQKYLNSHGLIIAKTGSGLPGQETNYFGKATKQALGLFQLKNKIILNKSSKSFGSFGPVTRRFVNRNH